MVSEVSLEGVKSPEDEVGDDETVLGTLSNDLKRLYVVMLDAKERTRAFHEQLKSKNAKPGSKIAKKEKMALNKEYAAVNLEIKLIHEMFWASVRLEFYDVSNNGIGLRRDWQIVLFNSKAEFKKSFAKFLKLLS